jgi:DNA-binding PucR family transcriptional regulator
VLVADPEAPGRDLPEALAGRAAAVGPAVPWPEAGGSVARASAAARLAAAGRLPSAALPVVADDHLVLLAVHADPGLAQALARRAVAPLAEAAGAERGGETLRAWLDRPGQVQAVAATLGVHPQTVRYRLKRLRELYGAALEDPEERLALALALRAAGPDPLSV